MYVICHTISQTFDGIMYNGSGEHWDSMSSMDNTNYCSVYYSSIHHPMGLQYTLMTPRVITTGNINCHHKLRREGVRCLKQQNCCVEAEISHCRKRYIVRRAMRWQTF